MDRPDHGGGRPTSRGGARPRSSELALHAAEQQACSGAAGARWRSWRERPGVDQWRTPGHGGDARPPAATRPAVARGGAAGVAGGADEVVEGRPGASTFAVDDAGRHHRRAWGRGRSCCGRGRVDSGHRRRRVVRARARGGGSCRRRTQRSSTSTTAVGAVAAPAIVGAHVRRGAAARLFLFLCCNCCISVLQQYSWHVVIGHLHGAISCRPCCNRCEHVAPVLFTCCECLMQMFQN
jgi:hypothetical protein